MEAGRPGFVHRHGELRIMAEEPVQIPDSSIQSDESPVQNPDIPNEQIAVAQAQFAATYHSGPLPDPSQLEQYNKVCPGAADRIITMAEKEAEHRHCIETAYLKSSTRISWIGVISAAIICIATIAGGVLVIMNGHDWAGSFLGASGLAGVAGTFITGTKSTKGTHTK